MRQLWQAISAALLGT